MNNVRHCRLFAWWALLSQLIWTSSVMRNVRCGMTNAECCLSGNCHVCTQNLHDSWRIFMTVYCFGKRRAGLYVYYMFDMGLGCNICTVGATVLTNSHSCLIPHWENHCLQMSLDKTHRADHLTTCQQMRLDCEFRPKWLEPRPPARYFPGFGICRENIFLPEKS